MDKPRDLPQAMQQKLRERIAPDTTWQREAHIAKAKKQMCFAV